MELFNLKDHNEKVSFAEAVVKGIGKDQGLFFPDHIVPLNNVDELLDMPLVERSQKILRHLIGDEVPELEAIIADAFTFKAPIVKADENVYALELFHGPTLAFKDFGARFMARVLGAIRGDKHLTILTATSGDTGAAVAAAFYEQNYIQRERFQTFRKNSLQPWARTSRLFRLKVSLMNVRIWLRLLLMMLSLRTLLVLIQQTQSTSAVC